MKFLLDTNIILGIEDNRQVDSAFARLVRKFSEYNINAYIDSAIHDDVRRDRDEHRRNITLSKLDKFESLRPVGQAFIDLITEQTGAPLRTNDESDIRLLAAVAANAVDNLITEDLGLHRRARKANLSDRVLTVADAIKALARQFDQTEVALPFIRNIKAYEIDRQAKIFETLREDYEGFDNWFEQKCARQHRECWIVEVRADIAGILIPKEESPRDTDAKLLGSKILKICTFKIEPEHRGEKFGEQLLKKALWHAQSNKFDIVYLTAFEKQVDLISLLERFGFKKTHINNRGEAVLEKQMVYAEILANDRSKILELDRQFYPRIVDNDLVNKFIVPIRPHYHKVLFPEIALATPLPLFGQQSETDLLTNVGRNDRTPGNTIRKVYLCRSPNTNLRPGDIILFYQSKDEQFAHSQSVTTLGVVEDVNQFSDIDDLSKHVAKRSVFSRDDLQTMINEKKTPVKAIDFLLIGHSEPSISLEKLIEMQVLTWPPMSISQISENSYRSLKERLNLGFHI